MIRFGSISRAAVSGPTGPEFITGLWGSNPNRDCGRAGVPDPFDVGDGAAEKPLAGPFQAAESSDLDPLNLEDVGTMTATETTDATISPSPSRDHPLGDDELRERERRYRLLLDSSTDMISRHALDGRILYTSPACRALLGFEPEDLVGVDPYTMLHPEDLESVRRSHRALAGGPGVATVVYRHRRKDGRYIWFETTGHAIRDPETGLPSEIHCASRDITDRKQLEDRLSEQLDLAQRLNLELEAANARLAELAFTDGLTGLANHRRFREALAAACEDRGRRPGTLAVVLIDIDHFKQYNDTFGHPAGDEVLRGVARVLRANVRPGDTVARYGGEEFVALLPSARPGPARILAERLRRAIESHRWPHRPVTASLGVAAAPDPTPDDAGLLIESADRALYRSKALGRNRVSGPEPLPPLSNQAHQAG